MEKTKFGFSCSNCTTIIFPIPLFEALDLSKCPNCDHPISSQSDYIYWECDNCEAHNDYDWKECYSCGNPKI